jgi:hypothetical protein
MLSALHKSMHLTNNMFEEARLDVLLRDITCPPNKTDTAHSHSSAMHNAHQVARLHNYQHTCRQMHKRLRIYVRLCLRHAHASIWKARSTRRSRAYICPHEKTYTRRCCKCAHEDMLMHGLMTIYENLHTAYDQQIEHKHSMLRNSQGVQSHVRGGYLYDDQSKTYEQQSQSRVHLHIHV